MSPLIMVVDDEPSLVHGLTYALERERFEVEAVGDGRSAVELALSRAFDLILLDVSLPRLSGVEACREIRGESDVPIIMLTARDSEREIVEGLASGADDYVTKPFSGAELLERIRSLLRRREIDRAANDRVVHRVGGITIDFVNDMVEIDGKPVPLTPSEFKILRLLASAPEATWTKRQIMEHLWGSTHVGDEHTCEVHISTLRRKIERDPSFPERLVTVRGVGYSLSRGRFRGGATAVGRERPN